MKVFYHSNLLSTTLKLGLGKIGTVVKVVWQNSWERVLFVTYLTYLKPNNLECICLELTISNKIWVCLSIYTSPNSQNIDCFFNEFSDSFSKANDSYENFVFMGEFNIDIGIQGRIQRFWKGGGNSMLTNMVGLWTKF